MFFSNYILYNIYIMPLANFVPGGTIQKRVNPNLPNSGTSFAGLRNNLGGSGITSSLRLVGKGGGLHKSFVIFQNQVGGIGRGTARKCGGPICNVLRSLPPIPWDPPTPPAVPTPAAPTPAAPTPAAPTPAAPTPAAPTPAAPTPAAPTPAAPTPAAPTPAAPTPAAPTPPAPTPPPTPLPSLCPTNVNTCPSMVEELESKIEEKFSCKIINRTILNDETHLLSLYLDAQQGNLLEDLDKLLDNKDLYFNTIYICNFSPELAYKSNNGLKYVGKAFESMDFEELKQRILCLHNNKLNIFLVMGELFDDKNNHYLALSKEDLAKTSIETFVNLETIDYPEGMYNDKKYKYSNNLSIPMYTANLDNLVKPIYKYEEYSTYNNPLKDFILLASDLGVDGIEIMYREDWYIKEFGIDKAMKKFLSILLFTYISLKNIKPSLLLGINLLYNSLDKEGILTKISQYLENIDNEFIKEFLNEVIYPFGSGINLENNSSICSDSLNIEDNNISSCLCNGNNNCFSEIIESIKTSNITAALEYNNHLLDNSFDLKSDSLTGVFYKDNKNVELIFREL